ncbi:p5.5 [Mulberry crinivirus]|nr:p5.5 [Mulberry crinivirus]
MVSFTFVFVLMSDSFSIFVRCVLYPLVLGFLSSVVVCLSFVILHRLLF